MHVADALLEAIDKSSSFACVGLDPRPSLLPPGLRDAHLQQRGDTADAVAAAFVEFNRGIIEAVAGRCAAVKPQSACYEAYGRAGWAALEETVRAARDAGMVVIVDAKRGDVGSTAEHYSQAIFGGAPTLNGDSLDGIGAHWVTANSYLGSDSINAFLSDDHTHGVFVLVKTSSPSSAEIQEVRTLDGTVSEQVARLVATWGEERVGAHGFSDVGAVVGATYPREAQRLRELMPRSMFLVPGYGAQGADAASAVAGARNDGTGIIVNASRSVSNAWQTLGIDDWREAARTELDRMNRALFAALRS